MNVALVSRPVFVFVLRVCLYGFVRVWQVSKVLATIQQFVKDFTLLPLIVSVEGALA